MTKRVMFTGGSGKAGKHVVQYLVEHGYQVLNLDAKPLDNPKVRTLITDITDSGQVFNALSSYMGLHEFDPSLRPDEVKGSIPQALLMMNNPALNQRISNYVQSDKGTAKEALDGLASDWNGIFKKAGYNK